MTENWNVEKITNYDGIKGIKFFEIKTDEIKIRGPRLTISLLLTGEKKLAEDLVRQTIAGVTSKYAALNKNPLPPVKAK